jgi:hypothetical protein
MALITPGAVYRYEVLPYYVHGAFADEDFASEVILFLTLS